MDGGGGKHIPSREDRGCPDQRVRDRREGKERKRGKKNAKDASGGSPKEGGGARGR